MKREIELDALESRVFGVLVEKALTTPDQYPLTLNSATTGSNQKSNRQPVLQLEEDEIAQAIDSLEAKYLVRRVYPGNSRVEKYCHNGKEALGLDAAALSIVAELLLRGPQTIGELRAHAGRMIELPSLDAVQDVLRKLIDEAYVERLPPLPGSRAERYVQLMSPGLHPLDTGASAAPMTRSSAVPSELAMRVERLEAEVARLREIVDRLVS